MLTAAGRLSADLPGGYNKYSALFHVYDQNGNPLSGVSVQLWVQTWYGVEWDPEIHNCWKNGVTGSYGSVYLECLIPPELSEGLLFMEASMTDSRYTVISSQNTWSNCQTGNKIAFFSKIQEMRWNLRYLNSRVIFGVVICILIFQTTNTVIIAQTTKLYTNQNSILLDENKRALLFSKNKNQMSDAVNIWTSSIGGSLLVSGAIIFAVNTVKRSRQISECNSLGISDWGASR